jgi:DNA-binding NarL/FixJ family response regulator
LAVKSALKGEMYFSPGVSHRVITHYMRDLNLTSPLDLLSTRQREILQLLAEGHANKEVAKILDISVKTVETHRRELMEKLGIHDVASLVRLAIRLGLVKAE